VFIANLYIILYYIYYINKNVGRNLLRNVSDKLSLNMASYLREYHLYQQCFEKLTSFIKNSVFAKMCTRILYASVSCVSSIKQHLFPYKRLTFGFCNGDCRC
jgi:hypothetical protein